MKSNMSYETQILDAVQKLVDNAVENAGYDKTIQCKVLKVQDAALGKYRVKYQDSAFYAYSPSTDVTYSVGSLVYVLIPGNDMSHNKTILGSVDSLGVDYVTNISIEEQYDIIGNNISNSSEDSFGLSSYKDGDTKVLYDVDNNINLIGYNAEAADLYIKNGNSLLLGAYFKTNLDTEQRFKGNYGIAFKATYLDENDNEIVRDFIIDVDNMNGNPYALSNFTKQISAYELNGSKFQSIDKIEIFAENFPFTDVTKGNDIFVKDVQIYSATKMLDNELSGYGLSFITPQGVYFDNQSADTDSRAIQAQIRVKGKVASSNFDKVSYYWFKENASISSSSLKYNKLGGSGWECLNSYNIIDDTDVNNPLIEWVSGSYEYKTTKINNLAKENKYKCVAVYNEDIILEKELIIYNLSSNYSLSIESTNGNQFYFDVGNTDLICKVNGVAQTSQNYTYAWGVTDSFGTFTKIDDNDNTYENVEVNNIINYSVYKCSVWYNNNYIGTTSIILYNSLEKAKQYNLNINNGIQVFKYDENGIAPNNGSLEKPITILPLTFTLYDEKGKEIPQNGIPASSITWRVPATDTMISIPSEYGTPTEEDGYYLYHGLYSLGYDIAARYNASKTNNDIELEINYEGISYKNKTNLSLIKEGESGTNGTDFICKIVPNIAEGELNDYPTIKYNTTNGTYSLNYTPVNADNWFKVQLWHDGVKIYEGNASGLSNVEMDESGNYKPVTVEWSMLKNKYASLITEDSNFTIDKDTGGITLNTTQYTDPANIVKCTVTYNGIESYDTMPIIFARVSNSDYNISLKKYSGFRYAMYSADGRYPQYDDNIPFEIIVKNGDTDISEDLTYTWSVNGTTFINGEWVDQENLVIKKVYRQVLKNNQKYFKPVDTYNGMCINNAITCEVNGYGSIHIPIDLYLNRYGKSLINGWDGNSISINNDEGLILSPQVGAGKKENDNSFTGVFIGSVQEDANSDVETGLYAYSHGQRTIALNAEDGSAEFGTTGSGQIIIDPSTGAAEIKSGNYVAGTSGMKIDLSDPNIQWGNGNFSVDHDGKVTATQLYLTRNSNKTAAEEVADLDYATSVLQINPITNNIIIPCGTDHKPTETKNYIIQTYPKFKNIDVSGVTCSFSPSSITNLSYTWSATNKNITVRADSTKAIENRSNVITATFSYKDANNKTWTQVQRFDISLGLQGTQGVPGPSGTASYFHYYYSNVNNPSGFSQMTKTPSTYMGTYVDNVEADSTNPSDYTWFKLEGTDGQPGKNGTNGKTTYLHIKYSNDGGQTFTGNSGEEPGDYIGQYTDYIQADSSDVSRYTWALIKGEEGESSYTHVKYADDASGTNMSDTPLSTSKYLGVAITNSPTAPAVASEYNWALIKGADGTSPYFGYLTNENHTYTFGKAQNVTTQLFGYYGDTEQTVTVVSVNGVNASTSATNTGITGLKFKVDSITAKLHPTITFSSTTSLGQGVSASIPIIYTIGTNAIPKTVYFSASSTVKGDAGVNAKLVDIEASGNAFVLKEGASQYTPDAITLYPRVQGDNIAYSKWQYSADGGSTWTDVTNSLRGVTLLENGNLTISNDSFITTGTASTYTLKACTTIESVSDTTSIIKVSDGDSLTIVSSVDEYQVSSSNTTIPTGTWYPRTNIPTTSDTNKYLWTKNTITFSDGTKSYSYGVSSTMDSMATFIQTTNQNIEDLQRQVDGAIMAWFENYVPLPNTENPTATPNYPANQWDTEAKKIEHQGDLFYIIDNQEKSGQCYRYAEINGEYRWIIVEDVDVAKALADAAAAQATADGKAAVFTGTTTPTDPNEGDIWFKGTNEGIYTYVNGSWVVYNKYTDDTRANAAYDLAASAKTLNVLLTNENHTIATDKDGNNGDYSGAKTTVQAFFGNADVTSSTTVTVGTTSNVTGSLSGKTYSVTNLTADSGYVDLVIKYTPSGASQLTRTARFSLSKSKVGATGSEGDPAKIVTISATNQVFKCPANSTTYSPTTITLTPSFQHCTLGNWQYFKTSNSTWTNITSTTSSTTAAYKSGNNLIIPSGMNYNSNATSVAFRCLDSTGNYFDVITILKVKDGNTGATGKGISSIVNHYLATDKSSGITISTSGWTTTIQTMTATNKYLWNYETVNYTIGDPVNTTPCIIGTYGDKGQTGPAGNGITSIVEEYALSTSASSVTGTWSETIPTLTATNKYLWNRETINYTNSDPVTTTAKIIGVYGDKGDAGKGISGSVVTYQAGTSGTAHPTDESGWTSTIPTVTKGQFLWTRTVITYTDNSKSTVYAVSYQPIDGKNGADGSDGKDGADGRGISSSEVRYKAGTSGTTKPSGAWIDWSTTVPSITKGQYLWTWTKYTFTDNTTQDIYSVGYQGTNGTNGESVKTITNYYLATDKSSGVTTSTSGWSTSIQTMSSSKPYLWNYEIVKGSNNTTLSTTTPVIIGHFGINGNNGVSISSIVEHYAKSSSNSTAPSSWSETTVPTLDVTNRYLWNYETIYYSDGTHDDTLKRIIGVYGDTGIAGRDSYLHIKYMNADSLLEVRQEQAIPVGDTSKNLTFTDYSANSYYIVEWEAYSASTDTGSGVLHQFYDNAGNRITYYWTPMTNFIADSWNKYSVMLTSQTASSITKYSFGCRATNAGAEVKYRNIKVLELSNLNDQSGEFIGTYTDNIETASTNPRDYNWSRLLGDTGVAIENVVDHYALSTSSTSVDPSNWQDTPPTLDIINKYLWNYETITYTDGSIHDTSQHVIGTYGETGQTGESISTITNYYLATNSGSGVTRSTSGWTTTIQSPTSSKKYLWNYEDVIGNKGTTISQGTPHIIGVYGDKGNPGDDGKKLVYFGTRSWTQSQIDTYCAIGHTESSWIQSLNPGVAVVNGDTIYINVSNTTTNTTGILYIQANATTTASQGASGKVVAYVKDGDKGETGNGITSTVIEYQASSSGTATPTGTWTTTVPSVSKGQYLWTRTTINYNEGDPKVSYSVGYQGTNGSSPYNVILTNEAQTIAGSTSAAKATTFSTNVIGYQGTSQVNTTVGSITGLPTGMTAAISNNSSKTTSITFTVTTSMVSPNGEITIPITVGSTTINKKLSYSVSYTGTTGTAARTYEVVPSVTSVIKGADDALTPNTLTFSAYYMDGNSTSRSAYSGTWWIQYSTDGSTWTDLVAPSTTNATSRTVNLTNNMRLIRAYLGPASTTPTAANALDYQTVPVLTDIDNVNVGGRNLILDTSDSEWSFANNTSDKYLISNYAKQNIKSTDTLTLSVEAKGSVGMYFDIYFRVGTTGHYSPVENYFIPGFEVTTSYQKFTFTGLAKEDLTNITGIRIRQNTTMHGGSASVGTLYIKKLKLEIGNVATDWTPAPEDVDKDIQTAQDKADSAYTLASGKIVTYYQASQPSSGMHSGDLWIDSDAGNKMYRYNGSSWVAVTDTNLATNVALEALSDVVDGKSTTYYSPSQPTGASTGDIWYDQTNQKIKRYNGSSWVDITSTALKDALDAAAAVQTNLDNLEIGGRNLILNGSGKERKGFFKNFTYDENDKLEVNWDLSVSTSTWAYRSVGLNDAFVLSIDGYEPGAEYTWSYDIMYTEYTGVDDRGDDWIGQRYTTGGTQNYQHVSAHYFPTPSVTGMNTWYHFVKTIKIPSTNYPQSANSQSVIHFGYKSSAGGKVRFKLKNVKLERGNKATDWTPAPEDITAEIESARDLANQALEKANADMYGVCSTTGTTRTVTIPGVAELTEGMVIYVKFTAESVSNMTLNVNDLGAKTVYYQNNSTGTYIKANSVVSMIYDTTTVSTGCWKLLYSYNSNTEPTYLKYNNNIKAATAIVAANIIVGDANGYHHLKDGTAFDISYPILYAGSNINAGSTGTNNYISYPFAITTTQSGTFELYKMVYIKGTLNGNIFTPISTTPLTQTVPTSVDNYVYISLGSIYQYSSSKYYLRLEPSHDLYQYYNNEFRNMAYAAMYAANDAANDAAQVQTNLDNLEIGGRNLLVGWVKAKGNSNPTYTNFSAPTFETDTTSPSGWRMSLELLSNNANARFYITSMRTELKKLGVKDGDTLTISYYAKTDSTTMTQKLSPRFESWINATYIENPVITTNWNRISFTGTFSESTTYQALYLIENNIYSTMNVGEHIYLSAIKIERGDKATDWSPTPEDVDATIQTAQDKADSAYNLASGKIVTYYQASQPTNANNGDLWIDSDNNNKMYRYANNQWTAITDTSLATNSALEALADTVDGKSTTYYGTTTPSNPSAGDIWYNNSTGKIQRYSGSAWVDITSAALKDALDAATQVQTNLDNLEIGGRNYILDSATERINVLTSNLYNTIRLEISPAVRAIDPTYKTFIFSCDAYYEYDDEIDHEVYIQLYFRNNESSNKFIIVNTQRITRTWQRVYCIASFRSETTVQDAAFVYFRAQGDAANIQVHGKNFKVEKGLKNTDWTPAPEDIDADITEAQTTANAGIKSVTNLYYASNSTTAPNKPTAHVTTNNANTRGAWNIALPTYDASYPYLYTCKETLTNGGTYGWTAVVQSTYASAIAAIKTTADNAASNLATYITNNDQAIADLQSQIDGAISTWFYAYTPASDNYPASEWTTDAEKNRHLGDLFYVTKEAYTSAINYGTRTWNQSTVNTNTKIGYTNGWTNNLGVAINQGDVFYLTVTNSSDNNSTGVLYIKADQTTTSSQSAHGSVVGYVKDGDEGKCYRYAIIDNVYQWILVEDSDVAKALEDAARAQATADGKATIYSGSTTPTGMQQGDLWFKGANEPILTYVNNQWVEYNKYTDDSATTALETDLHTNYSRTYTFSEHNKYIKLGTITLQQSGYSAVFDVHTGNGFNAYVTQEKSMKLTLRTSNGSSSQEVKYAAHIEYGAYGGYKMYVKPLNTAQTQFEIWIDKVTYTGKSTFTVVTAGTFTEGISTADTLPDGCVEATKLDAYDKAATAQSRADAAYALADGKIVTFAQNDAPAAANSDTGDLWIDTNDGNKLYRYNGSSWVLVQDTNLATVAQFNNLDSKVNTKSTTYYTTTQPSSAVNGDIWYNSSTGIIKRYNGSSWVDITNQALKVALDAAGDVQTNLDNLEIGGRNLILDTANEKTVASGVGYADVLVLSPYAKQNVKSDTYLTLTFEAKGSVEGKYCDFYWRDSSTSYTSGFYPAFGPLTTEYQKFTYTHVASQNLTNMLYLRARKNTSKNGPSNDWGVLYIRNLKLEVGNKITDWTPAPEDLQSGIDAAQSTANDAQTKANNSIKSTSVQYYVSTSPTSMTGGSWSDTAPTYAAGTYVWTRYKITPTVGNASYTTGVPTGSQKQISNSKTQYYLSTSNSSQTGGSWVDTMPTAVSGKYIWIRQYITYADNTTSTGTATLMNGLTQMVIDANNYADTAVNNIQIGGRNYFLKANTFTSGGSADSGTGSTSNTIHPSIENGLWKVVVDSTTNSNWNSWSHSNVIETNFATDDVFTFSMEIKSADAVNTTPPQIYFKNGMGYYAMKGSVSSDWSRVYYTGKWKDTNSIALHLGWNGLKGTYYIQKIKFEAGNKPTDWTLAPEDTDSAISQVQSNLDTYIDAQDLIIGTQTATTGTWTGVANFDALTDGTTILYWLPYDGSGNATLNLTLKNGSTTGAKNCYYSGTSRLTTHYKAGNVIQMTYRENVSIKGSTTLYTGWWAKANYDDGNTYDRIRFNNNIKAKTAITNSRLIVGDNSGFFHLSGTSVFDIDKPILWASSNIDASANGNNNYLSMPTCTLRNNTNSSWTATQNKTLYLVGILNGQKFTPRSTNYDWLTTTVPTSEDGYVYISLGLMISTYQIYLYPEHPMFMYSNGEFKSLNQVAYDAQTDYNNLVDLSAEVEGNPIVINNAANTVIKDLFITGNYAQHVTTANANICPFPYNTYWEAGHYSTSGAKENQNGRIRLKNLLRVNPSTTYYFDTNTNVANHKYDFVIRTFNKDKTFVRSIGGVTNKATFTTNSNEYYLGVAIYDENGESTTASQYSTYFSNGSIKPFICLNSASSKTYVAFIPTAPSFYYPANIKTTTSSNNVTVSSKNLVPNSEWTATSAIGSTIQWSINPNTIYGIGNGKTYTLSLYRNGTLLTNNSYGYCYVYAYRADGSRVGSGDYMSTSQGVYTRAFANDVAYVTLQMGLKNVAVGDVFTVQLEEGSTRTEYEDNSTFSYPINIGTDFVGKLNDSVIDILDWSTGELTKKVGKIQFTGASSENWAMESGSDYPGGYRFYIPVAGSLTDNNRHPILSNYFSYVSDGHAFSKAFQWGGKIYIYPEIEINTVAKLKTWLAAAKPIFYYALQNSDTITYNLPNISTHQLYNYITIDSGIYEPMNLTYYKDSLLNNTYASFQDLEESANNTYQQAINSSVTSITHYYYVTTSGVIPSNIPDSSWTTSYDESYKTDNIHYIWNKDKFEYGNGSVIWSSIKSLKNKIGYTTQYAGSTSSSTAPITGWNVEKPTNPELYIWTRTATQWDTGIETYSDAICDTLLKSLKDDLDRNAQDISKLSDLGYVRIFDNYIYLVDKAEMSSVRAGIAMGAGGIQFFKYAVSTPTSWNANTNTFDNAVYSSVWTLDGTMDLQELEAVKIKASEIADGILKLGEDKNTPGHLEIYSTNSSTSIVTADGSGIKVKLNNGGEARISVSEGFTLVDSNGNQIYGSKNDLNKFEMTKGKVTEELDFNACIKMVPITLAGHKGIAFIRSTN